MNTKKIYYIVGLILAGSFLIFALYVDMASDRADENGAGQAGLANPAAVYCQERGGEYEGVETDEGTRGYCRLPDGQICDEWVYFNSDGQDCEELDRVYQHE